MWPKIYFRILHIYNITKLYGVWKLICIAWCTQWYLFRTVDFYIFILYIKLVRIKRNEVHLSAHHTPLYTTFTYSQKLSLGHLKVCPNTSKHVSSFSHDIYNDDHCIWSESMIRTLDFKIHSLRSPFTFCGYYTFTGSPYNSVFAQDTTSWPVKRSMWHL